MTDENPRVRMSASVKKLIFCVHAHQPVGNFDHVFEEAFQKSYRPFFETLQKHSSIRISAHFSGSLLDWLESHHPEFINLLKAIYQNNQIEFIGGGYYEPIYGMIPKNDLIGQIAMLRKRLKELFGAEFSGVWLTERVWDPGLVTVLNQCGVKFTILDDAHFERAGLAEPIMGHYRTKKGKARLELFASMKNLRYSMPFHKADEALDWIRKTPAGDDDVFTFADDCEKFGLWPGTYDWVYKEKWLEKFWELIEQSQEVKVVSFEDALHQCRSKSDVYIEHASYTEMMEWSGGRFYNFFDKYPESRYMRDRMLAVSRRAGQSVKAKPFLYRAQCNCSYWHGVFGGLYLHHLRSSVFENLIGADKCLDQAGHVTHEKIGLKKYAKTHQKDLTAYFDLEEGGAMRELDYFPKSVNLMCNLRRQKEIYHEVALAGNKENQSGAPMSIHDILGMKEKGLEKHLFYDRYARSSFLDHFFEAAISKDEFIQCAYKDIGDFSSGRYQMRIEKTGPTSSLLLFRKGMVTIDSRSYSIDLRKRIVLKSNNEMEVSYEIKNLSTSALAFTLGVEFNFSIGDEKGMRGIDQANLEKWDFYDSWRQIPLSFSFAPATRVLAGPIETVSESESGLERTFQQLGVLSQRAVSLKPGESSQQLFQFKVG